MIGFKKWLIEWEGNNFSQEYDLVNGPQYPNSKYKGKGEPVEMGNKLRKIQKAFGFNNNDELLNLNKKMRPAKLDTSLQN
jgi:hypothetical protein